MTEQRSRSLTYEPITSLFNESSCMVYEIEVPEITRTQIIPVFITKDRTAQMFKTTERKEIITFTVTYVPMNNDAGKELLKHTKNLVESVLKKDFTPAVSTINTFRNGEIEKTINVNDCIIKGCSLILDKNDYIRIKFEISGILAADY